MKEGDLLEWLRAAVLLIPQWLPVKEKYKNPVLTQSRRLDMLAGLQFMLEFGRSILSCQGRNELAAR